MTTVTAPAELLAPLELEVRDESGRAAAGARVVLEQVRHRTALGCIVFDQQDLEAGDAAGPFWPRLFDQATLPFYWRRFEPEEGGPTDAGRLRGLITALRRQGVRIKGHPLVWHTLAPTWLLGRSPAQVEEALLGRVEREVRDAAGLVDMWDVVNESVILPDFTAEDNAVTALARARGRMHVIREAFARARAADPGARLVLNDFDLGPDYEAVVEECLEAGVPIDAVGLQTHMHQGYRGAEAIAEVLERFSRFGLPLQLTEVTLLSGALMPEDVVDLNDHVVQEWPSTAEGEERQARELLELHRLALAHPAVESMTLWGLRDEGAWLRAPAGLVRLDGMAKPAYEALRRQRREDWWLAPTATAADEDGRVVVHALPGEYRVEVDGTAHRIELEPGGSVRALPGRPGPGRG